MPLRMNGPYRPFCAVISSPSGAVPSVRGRVQQLQRVLERDRAADPCC